MVGVFPSSLVHGPLNVFMIEVQTRRFTWRLVCMSFLSLLPFTCFFTLLQSRELKSPFGFRVWSHTREERERVPRHHPVITCHHLSSPLHHPVITAVITSPFYEKGRLSIFLLICLACCPENRWGYYLLFLYQQE